MDQSTTRVIDAGPLLHLHWVGASSWALPTEPILVVVTVFNEVKGYAPEALDCPQLRLVPDVPRSREAWTLRLHDGEIAAISLALTYMHSVPVTFMCDDLDARRVAASLGIPVAGSLGLILAAYRSGRVERDLAEETLRALPTAGQMRLSEQLLNQTISSLRRNGD